MLELGSKQQNYVIFGDSQSCIHLCKNFTFHTRAKHKDMGYHWIRDVLNEKLLELEKIYTDQNGIDILTKGLPRKKLDLDNLIVDITFSFT